MSIHCTKVLMIKIRVPCSRPSASESRGRKFSCWRGVFLELPGATAGSTRWKSSKMTSVGTSPPENTDPLLKIFLKITWLVWLYFPKEKEALFCLKLTGWFHVLIVMLSITIRAISRKNCRRNNKKSMILSRWKIWLLKGSGKLSANYRKFVRPAREVGSARYNYTLKNRDKYIEPFPPPKSHDLWPDSNYSSQHDVFLW